MSVTLEPIVWIARAGPGHEKFGDPYTSTVTVLKADEQTVRFAGFTGTISLPILRQCAAAFAALGLTTREWTRHKATPP